MEEDAIMSQVAEIAWTPFLEVPVERVSISSVETAEERQWRDMWQDIEAQLFAFQKYHDDWDGFSSDAPDSSVINRAIRFAGSIKEKNGAAPSRVTLAPDGSVAIEWWDTGVCTQAEIGLGDYIEWVRFGQKGQPVHWQEQIDWEPGNWRNDRQAMTEEEGVGADFVYPH